MTRLTDDEIAAVQHLPRTTPYMIRYVTQTQFSIARYYGGIKFNGEHYTYFPDTDELVRDDVLKAVAKLRKPKKKLKEPTQ
jgi:hypothetical protein